MSDFDRNEARQFCRTLFEPKATGYTAMAFKVPHDRVPHRDDRAFNDYKPRKQERPDGSVEHYGWSERKLSVSDLGAMLDEVDQRMDDDPVKVMISPALYAKPTTRTLDNIKSLHAVHLDYDADGEPMDPELFRQLIQARPMLVWSGREHNFHAYVLVKGLTIETHRKLNRALRDKFGGDDKVSPNDLLTFPGTFNPKNGERVRLIIGGDL